MARTEGGAFTDSSIASLSGVSQTLLAADDGRSYILIQNTGANNIGVNLAGGAAAFGAVGTVTLQPLDSYEPVGKVPTNAITVIGTAGQPVACFTS